MKAFRNFGQNFGWRSIDDAQITQLKETNWRNAGWLGQLFERVASNSDNVVVLTGLGTSLCINSDSNKKSEAPSMLSLWEGCKTKHPKEFEIAIKSASYSSGNNIEELLERLENSIRLQTGGKEVVAAQKTIRGFIAEACDFLTGEEAFGHHKRLLKYLSMPRGIHTKKRFTVYTTNYDLCFEHAASQAGHFLQDGFSAGYFGAFDHKNFDLRFTVLENAHSQPDPIVSRLVKLHGSIDWENTSTGVRRRWRLVDSPEMVLPGADKVEKAVNSDLFGRLRDQLADDLRSCNVLVILGFGFKDTHISSLVSKALDDSPQLVVILVEVQEESIRSNAIMKKIIGKIEAGDQSKYVFNMSFEQFSGLLPQVRY